MPLPALPVFPNIESIDYSWLVPWGIRVATGMVMCLAGITVFQVVGRNLEKIVGGNNLVLIWLHEIGSDFRRGGKVIFFFVFWTMVIPEEYRVFHRLSVMSTWLSVIIVVDAMLVALAQTWKLWAKRNIPERITAKDRQLTLTIIPIATNFAKYIIHGVAAVAAVRVAGVDISPLLGATAIGMAVLGFAGQSLLQDLFAFVSLLIDRPYHVGSVVEFFDSNGSRSERGEVIEITVRNTVVLVKGIEGAPDYSYFVPNRSASGFRVFH
jgi:small-conductance mechanosensitive channel